MGKLPAFQFYPGDWLRDPELSRCSKAARGVWIDMLCRMFECESRGVLATGGVAWSDQEVAESIGGDSGTNLSHIQELLLKKVARRNDAGAIYSKRMVQDEQERRNTQKRVEKHRSNGDVTQKKRRCTEDEDETEVKNIETPDKFNREEWVNACLKAHPTSGQEWGQAAQSAVIDAICEDAKARGWSEIQAFEHVLARVQLYAQCVSRWPEEELRFVTGATKFFAKRQYNQDEGKWKRAIAPNGAAVGMNRNFTPQQQVSADKNYSDDLAWLRGKKLAGKKLTEWEEKLLSESAAKAAKA